MGKHTFEIDLTPAQEEKLKQWEDTVCLDYAGTIGGEFTWCFTWTSLGLITKVKHASGEQLDLTDYDTW